MNDKFWGHGFTDWVTTKKAKPLYCGHDQPFLPSKLGYYDLRDNEILTKQVELANKFGIDGFGFYHYVFDSSSSALSIPINNFYNNRSLDLNYFLCWVNEDWKKSWIGDDKTTLYKQCYSNDTITHLANNFSKYFDDNRYFQINGKPVLYIHKPKNLDIVRFLGIFTNQLHKNGYDEICLIAPEVNILPKQDKYFDFLLGYPPGDFSYSLFKTQQIYRKLLDTFCGNIINNPFLFRFLSTFSYKKYSIDYTNLVCKKLNSSRFIGTVLSGWDNTPRYGNKGYLFRDFNVSDFKNHVTRIFHKSVEKQKDFMMVKAWNEWAEGNVLEPSIRFDYEILKCFSSLRV